MTTKIITAPTVEPVSLDEARAHCRVDGTADDALLTIFIQQAREQAEHQTGRALCTQTREQVLDGFPCVAILRGAPIESVTSVKYLDIDGIERTLDAAEYQLVQDAVPAYVVPAHGKSWPATQDNPAAVRIRYACGYANAAAVPAGIKAWMLLAIGTLYNQRETIVVGAAASIPDGFWQSLLDPFKIYEVA